MKHTAFAAVVSLTLPFLAIVPASAQTVSTEDFVNKVAVSDMFEIQSGQLAIEKAKHEDVRDFGEQMVDDHTATSDELKELVKDEELNVTLPDSLDQDHQAKLDQLKGLSGAEFDKSYVPMQVKAHETAVSLFQDYSKSGDNEELKEWAGDTLPALKEHLKEAKVLNKEISKAAKTAAADTKDADAKDGKAAEAASNINYVTRQKPTDWSAQALIGRSVENTEGENLGEINNVIVNEKGDVVAVTIGVGGFLGLGEKDVGVPFDALDFRTEKSTADEAPTGKNDTADSRYDSEHSNMQIVLNATRQQLEKAPKFQWLDEQNDKRAGTDTVVE